MAYTGAEGYPSQGDPAGAPGDNPPQGDPSGYGGGYPPQQGDQSGSGYPPQGDASGYPQQGDQSGSGYPPQGDASGYGGGGGYPGQGDASGYAGGGGYPGQGDPSAYGGGYPPQGDPYGYAGGGSYSQYAQGDPYGSQYGGQKGGQYVGAPLTYDQYGGCYQDYDDSWNRKAVCFTKTQKVFDKIAIMMALLFAGLLVGPLAAPSGWHTKTTHIWTLYVGLYQVDVRLDTLTGSLAGAAVDVAGKGIDLIRRAKVDPDQGSALFKLMSPSEPKSLQFMRDQFCNVELFSGGFTDSCQVWTYLMYGSWVALLGLFIEIVFLLCGCMLMCMKVTVCTRWSVILLWMSGALIGCGTLAAYLFMSLNFKEWLTDVQLSPGDFTFSFVAVVASLLSFFCLFLGPIVMMGGSFPTSRYDERLGDMAIPQGQ